MSLKDELVKLGSQNPDLQSHIKPVLDHLEKMSTGASQLQRDILDFIKTCRQDVRLDPSLENQLDVLETSATDFRTLKANGNHKGAQAAADEMKQTLMDISDSFKHEGRDLKSNRALDLRDQVRKAEKDLPDSSSPSYKPHPFF